MAGRGHRCFLRKSRVEKQSQVATKPDRNLGRCPHLAGTMVLYAVPVDGRRLGTTTLVDGLYMMYLISITHKRDKLMRADGLSRIGEISSQQHSPSLCRFPWTALPELRHHDHLDVWQGTSAASSRQFMINRDLASHL